jgi:abortive infection bacteriophage resistance protein
MACSLFDVCQTADKKAIASTYDTKYWFLFTWMLSLSELRNRCAHYNRIYNIPFTKTPALYPSDSAYAGNKLFPLLLVMKHIVGKRDLWTSFVDDLSNLMKDYREARPDFMGFPENWHAVLCSIT